jgi:uncharacterized membrane protein
MTGAAVSLARFTSMLAGGLFAGFLVTVLVIETTLRDVGATVYTQMRHVELVQLDNLAAATLLPALLATAGLTVAVRRDGRRFRLTAAAFVLLLSVLVTTIAVNLPINTEQLAWSAAAPPADWARVRDQWQTAHAVRTVAAVLAFGCLVAAALRLPAAVPAGNGEQSSAGSATDQGS